MAVFGRSLYGTSTYGPDLRVPPVSALTVSLASRTSVELSWTPIGLGVSGVAVVRSRWGTPLALTSGQLLHQWTYDVGSAIDTAVEPGVMYYYGLFLQTTNGWGLSSAGSILVPRDHDYVSRFDTMVPAFYRGSSEDGGQEPLTKFLDVLAFGMDQVHTSIEATTSANDASKIGVASLAALGAEMGIDVPGNVTLGPLRKLVANAGSWASRRGTLAGLGDTATAMTGWATEVHQSQNLLSDPATSSTPASDVLAYYALNGTYVGANGAVTSGSTPAAWTASSGTVTWPPGSLVRHYPTSESVSFTWVNVGPSTITQTSSAATDANAPGYNSLWVKVADPSGGALGAYTVEQRTITALGAPSAPGSVTSSLTSGTVSGSPLTTAWTWTPSVGAVTNPASSAQATGLWSTVSSASLFVPDHSASQYGIPWVSTPGDTSIRVASFYTNTASAYPTVFGFDFLGNPTRTLSPSAAVTQVRASQAASGPLTTQVDPDDVSRSWTASPGSWFARNTSGKSLYYPSNDGQRQIAIAGSATGSVNTVSVTIAAGNPSKMGVVFCYADQDNYFYVAGQYLVWHRGGIDSSSWTLSAGSAQVGQRLTVSYQSRAYVVGSAVYVDIPVSVAINGVYGTPVLLSILTDPNDPTTTILGNFGLIKLP